MNTMTDLEAMFLMQNEKLTGTIPPLSPTLTSLFVTRCDFFGKVPFEQFRSVGSGDCEFSYATGSNCFDAESVKACEENTQCACQRNEIYCAVRDVERTKTTTMAVVTATSQASEIGSKSLATAEERTSATMTSTSTSTRTATNGDVMVAAPQQFPIVLVASTVGGAVVIIIAAVVVIYCIFARKHNSMRALDHGPSIILADAPGAYHTPPPPASSDGGYDHVGDDIVFNDASNENGSDKPKY